MKALWLALLTVSLALVVGTVVVATASDGTLGHVLLVASFTTPFVLLAVGALGMRRIARRAGIAHLDRVSFPEAAQLRRQGWTTVRLPLRVFRSAEKVAAGLERIQQQGDHGPALTA